MTDQYIKSGYHITTDPDFQNERYGNVPELRAQFGTLYFEAQDKHDKKIIDKLTNLIFKHPSSPQLKNFLSAAYSFQGKYKAALEVNQRILAEHPDYLFGKLNLANEYIQNREPEKVPSILGETMELKALYPDRELFHLAEVTGFLKTAIRYYTEIEDLEAAEIRLNFLEDIAPYHPDTVSAKEFLVPLLLKKPAGLWDEDEKNDITPLFETIELPMQTIESPVFNHPAINDLYKYGLKISPEILKEIVDLPRETLIEDLEKVLLDAEKRFEYFADMEWEDETHHFPFHAVFLLNEIHAVESFPRVILFLQNDRDFTEFWFGDHSTETLWRCFFGLGFTQLEFLKQLLLKQGVDTFIKALASEALCQIAYHYPEKRAEVVNIFGQVFSKSNEAHKEDNLIDSLFLGLTIGDVIRFGMLELLPAIKPLYEKNYVAIRVNGTYDELVKQTAGQSFRESYDTGQEIYGIVDLYAHILTTWPEYNGDEDFFDDDDEEEDDGVWAGIDSNYKFPPVKPNVPVLRAEPKVGRNDPCPCGSGKKYKKCCGGNL
ncbi:MAG: DUF1186 domain-containing protein [Bacteroidota bacterium]|nr:DUF1186 domain-containing protein [Bacteroidota bacterium]